MSPHKEELAMFIDGANLYATAKSLGFDIDYKILLVGQHCNHTGPLLALRVVLL